MFSMKTFFKKHFLSDRIFQLENSLKLSFKVYHSLPILCRKLEKYISLNELCFQATVVVSD